jgi:hypothetical protein
VAVVRTMTLASVRPVSPARDRFRRSDGQEAVIAPATTRGDLRVWRERIRARGGAAVGGGYDGKDELRAGTDAECRSHEAPAALIRPERSIETAGSG